MSDLCRQKSNRQWRQRRSAVASIDKNQPVLADFDDSRTCPTAVRRDVSKERHERCTMHRLSKGRLTMAEFTTSRPARVASVVVALVLLGGGLATHLSPDMALWVASSSDFLG